MKQYLTLSWSLALLGALLAFGAWLRFDQYFDQVLLDDEWHAVHQLLAGKGPAELLLAFGHADYSIPLGLLYWLEQRSFGLGEWAMRWPMLLAGLLSLALFSAWAWPRFSRRASLVFTGLLAASPMLAIFAHTARPYALTLLLSWLAMYALYRLLAEPKRLRLAGGYGLAGSLCLWLHPVTAPFVLGPLALEALRRPPGGSSRPWRPLAMAALAIVPLSALLLLPPWLADAGSLTGKVGGGHIGWDLLPGALHMWLGTPSRLCMLGLLVLALIGLPRVLGAERMLQGGLFGLVLTALALLLTQPAWVQHPLTFGRYLLPAVPLLALAAGAGFDRLVSRAGLPGKLALLASILLAAGYLYSSPVWRLIQRPNSNLTHSWYQFDFRDSHNLHARYMREHLPLSPFWAWLARQDGAGRVAVAPFYFESQFWDAPRWERLSGRRVVPAFLTGFCTDRRPGEVPYEPAWRFRNAWHLQRLAEPDGERPAWLVFNAPLAELQETAEGRQRATLQSDCAAQLRTLLGNPDYVDEMLAAWRL